MMAMPIKAACEQIFLDDERFFIVTAPLDR